MLHASRGITRDTNIIYLFVVLLCKSRLGDGKDNKIKSFGEHLTASSVSGYFLKGSKVG